MKYLILLLLLLLPNWGSAKQLEMIRLGHDALETGLIQGILAKEICTCVYVSKVGGDNTPVAKRMDKCLKRANLPMSLGTLNALVKMGPAEKAAGIVVKLKAPGKILSTFSARGAMAKFEGEGMGCRLLGKDEFKKYTKN